RGAGGVRRSPDHGGPVRHAIDIERTGSQGCGRDGDDRLAAGRHQRRDRRARSPRGHGHGAPRHAGTRLAGHSAGQWRWWTVIPAAFEYERADSVDDAVKLLSQSDGDAKLIAGGHSLLPLMRLRLSTPSLLIDIDRIADLSYVRDAGDMVEIGALSRMGDLAKDPVLAQHNRMMAHVAGQVGDP